PDQISGGEARRVALARALAPRPRLLLLDEPLTNLDGELKERLLGLLHRLVLSRATVLHVTHDEDEAAAVGDRIVRLAAGSLEATG
ncbi:MAG: ATP-binding cassette domain-containing protein, partial [Anaerolineae bacterium]